MTSTAGSTGLTSTAAAGRADTADRIRRFSRAERLVHRSTGLLMRFMGLLPSISRTSATFVHDFLARAIVGVLAGHVRKAYQDPETAPGMRTGFVSRS
ncbi:hypothetical protein [Streptomyces sp. NBC_00448]|uniref:hypothetical protein n=1 Tax=Streptomyces sp. NBC_00448 TaxID=2903652 RepID=UPI003FA7A49F